ncbi:MAG TPA: hypothetical protein VHG29_09005 [Novosphingobium sp.]|nr:hypothetical protein [Novosphingobium sp.]
MGGEAFLYPFLIFTCAVASVMFAVILRKILGTKYGFAQFLLVAIAAPLTVLLMAMRDPEMDWEYVRFSLGLSAITSCSVVVFYALIRLRK